MKPKAAAYKLFIMLGVALFIAASLFSPWTTVDKKQTSLITTGVGDAVSQQSKPKEDRETRARTQNGTRPNQQPAKRRRPTLLPQLELLPLTTTDTAALSELILPTVSSAEGLSAVEERKSEGSEREGARSDQPDEARRFRLLQMRDENGRIPADGLQKARAQVQVMQAAQSERAKRAGKTRETKVASLSSNDWTWVGPGNVGGRIRSVVIDPNNANRVWVGSVGGGIWHSTNAGDSWAPVNDFMANLAVSTMVINPNSANIMYAGTGEGLNASDGLQGGGVFQSTDSGVTWNLLASTNPAAAPPPAGCGGVGGAPCPSFWSIVNRLAISPDGSTILAGTDNGSAQSINGGGTWTLGNAAFDAGGVLIGNMFDVDFDTTNSQLAIAGGFSAALFSTDGGQNWSLANFRINPTDPSPTAISGRVEVAYAPSNPAIVYAAVNQNNGDIFRSTDGGQNYSLVNTGTNFFLGASNQGAYDNIIWVNPQDPTFIIVGGIDLWRSTNSGTNFTQISMWQCGPGQTGPCANTSAHADQHMIVAHPAFDNNANTAVYFGNDGGLFRADDVTTVSQTSGWTNLNRNLGITQFYSGAISATGVVFGGTQDNGTVKADPDSALTPPWDPQEWVPAYWCRWRWRLCCR